MVQKNFGYENIWVYQNFGQKKIGFKNVFGPNKFRPPKLLGPKVPLTYMASDRQSPRNLHLHVGQNCCSKH